MLNFWRANSDDIIRYAVCAIGIVGATAFLALTLA